MQTHWNVLSSYRSTPTSFRSVRRIFDHVVAVVDEVELTYFDVQRDIDLGEKLGIAEVVNPILGAPNRHPQDPARHFRGYAMLVIDARAGEAVVARPCCRPTDGSES